MVKSVAVIGAGIAGLAAAKAVLEEGHRPTIFEKEAGTGGLWRSPMGYTWKGMRANLSRWTCMLSDFPWPPGSTDFPLSQSIEQYITAYANAFQLTRHLHPNSTVVNVRQRDKKWAVKTQDLREEIFDSVIVTSGVFAEPSIPKLERNNRFKGPAYHSAYFGRGASNASRVAVIGAAFSGIEIAASLADLGKKVVILFDHPPWIVPRLCKENGHTVPVDLLLYRRMTMAEASASDDPFVKYEQTAEELQRRFGNPGEIHTELNVQTKNTTPYIAVSDSFLKHVQHSIVKPIRSKLAFVTDNEIVTDDGRTESVDEIVYCTGYQSNLQFLTSEIQSAIEYDKFNKFVPYVAYKTVYHPALHGLYFVGLYRGPYFGVIDLQARWVAAMIAERVDKPPLSSVLQYLVEERKLRSMTPRPQFPHGNYVEFSDQIAQEIGVSPISAEMKPSIAEAVRDGPVIPSQYRLSGRGANCEIAEPVVMEAYLRARSK